MIRHTAILGIVAALVTSSADAAATKGRLIACKNLETLRTITQMRTKKDPKGPAFEAETKASRECIETTKGATVGIDIRNGPFACIRPPGDLDCFWTLNAFIDEFPIHGKPGVAAPSGGR